MGNFSGSGHKFKPTYATRFFDTSGYGFGSIDMNVDGSETPVEFLITCPPGVKYETHHFSIFIQDTGAVDMSAYGNSVVLTNGIRGEIRRPGLPDDEIFVQRGIYTNSDWMLYCHKIEHLSFGTGDEALKIIMDFSLDGKGFDLYPGQSGVLTIQDDLTDLNVHVARLGMVSEIHIVDGI
jgi:hypothetical protein